MSQKWDERYKDTEFAYGTAPNAFFKEWLPKFKPGAILMPADGEGRNGVFASQLNWKVTSFDLSTEAQIKALQLASENNVNLHYVVGNLEALEFEKESFDAIGLIYAHFSAETKSALHKKLSEYLKPGGLIIFEAFSKNHIAFKKENPKVGGPDNIDDLFSKAEIASDFSNYEIIILEEEEIRLNEGKFHVGTGSVIRFVGRKRNS
ncbi:bifunctional 2-polyprenyl-6-hydroxyphenol methylase/3-demethylubiquinol 3-O-methyltransferase UbiG [Flavobacterium sp. CLA17]|uniref:class I SAM-dependent methyltransferase n=1 Tax=Flavobacterium sp. CLA17 TaxID=2724135 RepID=UPI0014930176|nr:class I SAM-dependent methyltransferase [Flavobacterium sp. CLA17]QSB27199.1 class I SAM-dependent methyltransferase [Flavobacterium sp. CLA17]